jgi:autotransporter-associated beta strand protein
LDIQSFASSVAGVQLTSGSIVGAAGVLTSATNYDVQSGDISAQLAGNVGLDKTTPGVVVLTGPNSYTGTTTVFAGTLELGPDAQAAIFGGVGGTEPISNQVSSSIASVPSAPVWLAAAATPMMSVGSAPALGDPSAPEPSSLILLACAFVSLLCYARLRRRR